MEDLEKESQRFEANCVALHEYQSSLITICRVWTNWLTVPYSKTAHADKSTEQYLTEELAEMKRKSDEG